MPVFKKTVFSLLAAGFMLYLCQGGFVHAQDLPDNNLQFGAAEGKIYFFQPQTGRIYVYQTATNRFIRLLILEKLGKDLKQSRSASFLEQTKEE